MEKREFDTRFGPIWLWGAAEAFTGSRPLVLVITGAFNAERSQIFALASVLQGADVLIGHLPGNHAPDTIHHSVGVYAGAYAQVIASLERPVVVVGASIGGLVALSLKAPNIRSILAIEPPIRTGRLWPLLHPFRQRLQAEPKVREFLWNVFGISEDVFEDRNYEAMLAQLKTPTRVLLGTQPLFPEREITTLPSLIDEPEREVFARHPAIKITVIAGAGHNIPAQAFDVLAEKTQAMIDAVLSDAAAMKA
jgi:pimeloyl-ACP methyl ester carboxylesterase